MPLFHPSIIEKHTKHVSPLSKKNAEILAAWSRNLSNGVYDTETQHDGEFIQRILISVLGYTGSIDGENWNVAKNEPVGKGNVDVALGNFTTSARRIIAPFELKGARTKDLDAVMPGRHKSPVQQAWEYAVDAKGAQWVLVSNYREIRLYAVGYGRKDYEVFDLSKLDNENEYKRFHLLISSDNLLGGNSLELLKESEKVGNEITQQLYTDYKLLRKKLIENIGDENPELETLSVIQFSQTILDRILFIAFAEDKGLLPQNTLEHAFITKNDYNPQPVWHNFKGLFTAINSGNASLKIPAYNGGLFNDDDAINDLVISDELCKSFKKLGDYNFNSDVSVNILGHIFEQSIGDIEELKANSERTEIPTNEQNVRRRDGIFYTPPYITRYIVEQAVGGWLQDRKDEIEFDKLPVLTDSDYDSIRQIERGKSRGKITFNNNVKKHIAALEEYREILTNIKVVDPACGSGAFLNEVFDYLKVEGEAVNGQLATLKMEQTALFRWDTHILANNIFGVDINRESVEITKLSLWLKTANKQEKLTYLEGNIRVGNSLVDDPDIANELTFNWNEEFSGIMREGGFDVVVGNPPYIDSEEMAKSQPKIRDYISSNYKTTKGNWDIYIAFFELSFRLLKPGKGYLSYITPDKWVSKDFGDVFRGNYAQFITRILELGRGVFEEAKIDSIITTFKYSTSESISTATYDGRHEEFLNLTELKNIKPPYKLDLLFSRFYILISKIEHNSDIVLSSLLECENACATSDAYELKKYLSNETVSEVHAPHYKVCNTGTLDKYVFKWGKKPMRYLKDSYLKPAVVKVSFHENFGTTYVNRAKAPKIIIKGLTLLDCAIDVDGSYIPGKSTLVVKSNDIDLLFAISAFLNSKLVIFYIKQKYASSSYNGGINFTKDMINNIPLPSTIDLSKLTENAKRTVELRTQLSDYSSKFLSFLSDEFEIDEIPTNLEYWYKYEFKEFISKTLKKSKLKKISLSKKSEWREYFEKEKAVADTLILAIGTIDNQIDQIIFDSYQLTNDEIVSICNAS